MDVVALVALRTVTKGVVPAEFSWTASTFGTGRQQERGNTYFGSVLDEYPLLKDGMVGGGERERSIVW